MGVDTKLLNEHIFSEGSVQFSPLEIQQLNNQPPSLFQATYEKAASNSGYKIFLTGYANKVLQKERSLNYGLGLQRAIISLRGNNRAATGFLKKGTTDTRAIDTPFHHIWYRIFSGQVVIYNIEPKDTIQLQRDKLEKTGLYKVKKNAQGVWEAKGKVDSVSTAYAAVNGQSNNLAKATWLMGAHLEYEFGKGAIPEYTLFHNPSVGGMGDTWESVQDKFGITTDVTRKFSQLLQNTQSSKNKTKWIAHSQGGLIFSEAVRYHLNGNSSWAITGGFNGAFRKDKGESLNMHSIAFHGNANNDMRSSILFERAGVEVIATRANDYDMVNTVIGLNTINPWRILGSVIYANHVMGGSVQQSPHTLMHNGFSEWDYQMVNGPGNGRNSLQKGFDHVDKAGRGGIKYIKNFLK